MSKQETDRILSQFQNNEVLNASEYQNTPNTILACMIHHAMQDDSFLPKAAKYLQPLVPRIMTIDSHTNYIPSEVTLAMFKGSKSFGIDRFFGKDPINPDNSAINDSYLNRGEFGVARLLLQLSVKAESLNRRKETAAYDKAHELYDTLHRAFMKYLNSDKGASAKQTLNTIWTQAINKAKPELEKHRGWSNFLVNMLLIIPTLGAFMIYSGCKSHGKNFLFPFVDTNSAKHVRKLEQIDKYEFTNLELLS